MKWKPSAAAKREFAAKMQDPEYVAQRLAKKEAKQIERIEKSRFNYSTAGGKYVPTKDQHDFALTNIERAERLGPAYAESFRMVMHGFTTQTPVDHDHIHRVNTIKRSI